ncbi:DUF3329 domain-containing protein [Nocardia yunnanensis]|uniref:DUF3329 domain-containing protein n=1 Tax=Nocardia yunnanensis TaxID=2382165 RepID=A0A386ZPP2_9NOCA|nr:DUF3329 domain-containing protein [Nocardia yunnanensis]
MHLDADDEVGGTVHAESEDTEPDSATAVSAASPDKTGDTNAEASVSEAPGSHATTSRTARRRLAARARTAVRLARKGLPHLAVLLILALTVSTAVLGWKYEHRRDIDAAGQAALDAATAYAVTLTSVDTGNLDANFTAVLDGSTGEFRDTYTKSSTQLRQLLIDHKAAGHGVVLQSAIKSASENEVVVLLFVDQTVSNTDMPDPRIDHSRIVMTMQRVDGRWKAAKVDIP